MRIHIRHEIVHAYDPPVRFLNAALRLTPRSHESQHVGRWRVEIDGDSRIRASDDAFGNCMHALSVTGPTTALRILAEGIVETFDAAGIVRATVERFPPEFYLRETPLTAPGEAHRALAADLRADNPIERLHALLLHMPSLEAREETQTQQAGEQSQSQTAPPRRGRGRGGGGREDHARFHRLRPARGRAGAVRQRLLHRSQAPRRRRPLLGGSPCGGRGLDRLRPRQRHLPAREPHADGHRARRAGRRVRARRASALIDDLVGACDARGRAPELRSAPRAARSTAGLGGIA